MTISIDPMTFRRTVGQFATGVTVIASESDGSLHAMTANSFTSLSLDPPLVLVCLGKETRMGQIVRSGSAFSISILSAAQQDVSTYFAGGWKRPAPPAFSFTKWDGGVRLAGCAAALRCSVHAIHDGGDHWIAVGRVMAIHRDQEASPPLVFFAGRYTGLEQALASWHSSAL